MKQQHPLDLEGLICLVPGNSPEMAFRSELRRLEPEDFTGHPNYRVWQDVVKEIGQNMGLPGFVGNNSNIYAAYLVQHGADPGHLRATFVLLFG